MFKADVNFLEIAAKEALRGGKKDRERFRPVLLAVEKFLCEGGAGGAVVGGETATELISRATRHEITLRKPADLCTAEECRGILKSREATIIKGEKLQTQVARLYALEDTPNYGPPRLKDRTGTSLFLHLFRAGLVVVCYCRVCFNISIDN